MNGCEPSTHTFGGSSCPFEGMLAVMGAINSGIPCLNARILETRQLASAAADVFLSSSSQSRLKVTAFTRIPRDKWVTANIFQTHTIDAAVYLWAANASFAIRWKPNALCKTYSSRDHYYLSELRPSHSAFTLQLTACLHVSGRLPSCSTSTTSTLKVIVPS